MNKKEVLKRLETSAKRTLQAFRWNRKTLSTSYAAGRWTAREVLAHLSDAELVFLTRLRFMLAEENPAVPAWDADHWASKFAYGKRDIADHQGEQPQPQEDRVDGPRRGGDCDGQHHARLAECHKRDNST